MSGRTPTQRYEPSGNTILVGSTISSGREWLPMGYLSNWLNGTGAMLVPGHVVDKNVLTGTTGVLHYRAKTRLNAIERIWTLMLRSTSASCTATIKAPTATGTSFVVPVSAGRDTRLPIIYREILTAKASAVTDLTIEITAAGGDIEIDSVTCTELTRPLLNESGDLGINTEKLRPRERIYDSDSSVVPVFSGSLGDIRRVGLFAWAVPTITPVTRTGAYTPLLALSPSLLGPLLEGPSLSVTGAAWWSVYAKMSAGNGDVQVTTSQSLVNDSVNVTSGAFAWTTARSIDISVESMSADDGLQSGTFDDLTINIRGNGGNTLSIAGLCIWNERI